MVQTTEELFLNIKSISQLFDFLIFAFNLPLLKFTISLICFDLRLLIMNTLVELGDFIVVRFLDILVLSDLILIGIDLVLVLHFKVSLLFFEPLFLDIELLLQASFEVFHVLFILITLVL